MKYSIYVGHLLKRNSPVLEGARIEVNAGRISAVLTGRRPSDEDVKLPDAVCCAALINAHDHLKYTWPVKIGADRRVLDSYEWLPTLYGKAEREFLQFLKLEDLYWLGIYKNILSGVVTIGNHSRRLPRSFLSRFPSRILTDFAREIFVKPDNRAHQMGLGAEKEIEIAKQTRVPFVVHLAEGLNHGTEEELEILWRLGGLFDGAVLVHGINLSSEDVERIAQAGASVVWCPVSNEFLFGRTAPIKELLDQNVNIALGTDSTCTGSPSLVHEMRFAITKLSGFMPREIAARRVFELVTVNAARAYKKNALGQIAPGSSADLLFFETQYADPFVGLSEMTAGQIVLLTCRGKWLLCDSLCTFKIPSAAALSTEVTLFDIPKRIVGDPNRLVNRVSMCCSRPESFFPLGRSLGYAGCR